MPRHATASELKNTIEFKHRLYARHGFASPGLTTLNLNTETTAELPVGWQIAPDDPDVVREVIAKHAWGIQVMLVAGGKGYNTASHSGQPAGRLWVTKPSLVEPSKTEYSISACGYGILICIEKAPSWSAERYRAKQLLGLGKARKFTDCRICCKGEVVACHRAVLAQSSPVFERMLSTEMIEGSTQCIDLANDEPVIVKAMIEFMYTGLLEVEDEGVAALLAQADFYQMDELMCACAEHALKIINTANAPALVRGMRPLLKKPEWKPLVDKLVAKLKQDDQLLIAATLGS